MSFLREDAKSFFGHDLAASERDSLLLPAPIRGGGATVR